MDDVHQREPAEEAGEVGDVSAGPEATGQLERLDPLHPVLPGRSEDPLLRSASTAENSLVPRALKLVDHPRSPVGDGAPPPAAHHVEDTEGPHAPLPNLWLGARSLRLWGRPRRARTSS